MSVADCVVQAADAIRIREVKLVCASMIGKITIKNMGFNIEFNEKKLRTGNEFSDISCTTHPCPASSLPILKNKNLNFREINDVYKHRQLQSYRAKIRPQILKEFDRKTGKGELLLRLC